MRPPPLPPFGIRAVWTVLTAFPSGPWVVASLVAELVAVGWYLHAVGVLRSRGRTWPATRTAAFMVGVFCVALAWQSGIPVYAGSIFSIHIIQHLLLMSVAPILFALSSPVTLAMQTTTRARKVAALRLLHGRTVRTLTHPLVSGAGNYGLMFWFFLDGGIVVSMAHPAMMDAVNCLFLFFGCLVWWPVLSVDYLGRRRYIPPVRLLLGLSGMPFDTVLAISLLAGGASASIAPTMYTLTSVQEGAAVFWIFAMNIAALGSIIPARQWLAGERRKSGRNDDVLDQRAVVRNESRYGWWGTEVPIEADGTMRVPWSTAEPDTGRVG